MRYFSALMALCIALMIIPQASAQDSWSVDLIAGQNTTIGSVEFVIEGASLTATFRVVSAGWCLDVTHLYVSNVAPQRAAPGQFQYQHSNLDCVTVDTYTVATPAGDVFVAAHAESDFSPARANEDVPLADSGTMLLNTAGDSYFRATLDIDGLASQFPAWCVDLEHFITPGITYDVAVSETGNALVDKPEALDLILYVINQDYSALGATATDIQTAIWLLIDDAVPPYISPATTQIVADARANGEGFSPGCGQLMGVFMNPGPDTQNIMVTVPAPCVVEGSPREETAWGMANWGTEFRQGWGMYFQLIGIPVPATEEPAPPEPIITPEPVVEQPNNDSANNDNQNPPENNPPASASSNDGGNNGVGNDTNNGNAQGEPQRDNNNDPASASSNDGGNNGLGNDTNNGNAQGEPQRDNNNGNANGNSNGNNGNGNGNSNGNGNGN